MATMKRIYPAILASLALVLAVPAIAPATIAEVGVIPPTTSPETVPSCPASPCLAVSRTTGFQVKVATNTTLMTAPRAGTVVAWTITLGKPNATQIKFFNANEGGAAEAGIAILRPEKQPNLTYKLIAHSPTVKLQPYFGKTAQFPLEHTIAVKKGDIVALTVPDLGSSAGARLRQGHFLARQPRKEAVLEHQLAEHADGDRHGGAVLSACTRPHA